MAADDDSYSFEGDGDSPPVLYEDCFGIPLMEVFSMVYLGDEVIVPEKQLGTVKIENGMQHLYQVDDIDMSRPLITKGDLVMVTAQAPFPMLEEFDINFDLFCGAYKADICVKWENFYSDGVTIGKHRLKSPDYNGDIYFQYGLFTNASVANLELKLKKSGSGQVYGFVSASNSRLDHPSRASILFWKRSEDKIQVREDQVIPFSKSRVGVPLDSKFFVCVALNCDGKDYDASFTLVPQHKETTDVRKVVIDQHMSFELKVTWDVKENSW